MFGFFAILSSNIGLPSSFPFDVNFALHITKILIPNFETSKLIVYSLITSSSSFFRILPTAWLEIFNLLAIEVSEIFALFNNNFNTFFSFLVNHIFPLLYISFLILKTVYVFWINIVHYLSKKHKQF